MNTDPISEYASAQDPQRQALCVTLQNWINSALPQATAKIWHAIPVWFIGENPVVGFTARDEGVTLMFWNGQHFDEPDLKASGSFHMAEISYNDVSELDEAKVAGWLQKAGTSIWDMVGERNAAVAAKREQAAKDAPAKKRAAPAKKKAAPARKKAAPAKKARVAMKAKAARKPLPAKKKAKAARKAKRAPARKNGRAKAKRRR